ncbi:MAG: Ig domain-containing protein [Candidatus Nanopelagicales bacterium]|nr:Ig domain-containing protein [Candidatus Nanopelagicales bacterium]MCF8537725.1 Ig domain-containing protein [Candidatus Nanopelagicales bacterium]MCF8542775.1 Ig domain-containing protein [Candidatus Nanopelagicales bacterium]MCF8557875.1 Ig domain-containing protein [Candidatus Nanopelagicales bacterium]
MPSTNYNSVGAALASPGAVINYIDFHTTSLPAARVDNAYSASLSATFGLSILPDAWDVSPALPTGLTLNSSTGAITGTPTTASSGTYTFTATSFAGASVISARSSIDLPLTVTADPALTPAFGSVTSTSDGFTVTVTNHDPAYTWATSSSTGTSTISGTGLVTVTGLSAGASATVTVSTTRTGYTTGTAQQTGTATAAATPSPPPPTSPSNGTGDSSGSAQAQGNNLASPHLRVIPPGMFTWAQGDSGSLTVVENSGGRAEFSIHPALPQGLSIEPSSGDLRGKPTGVVPPSQFVVTGRNSSGTSSVTITLHVTSAKGGSAVAVRPADSVRFARSSTTLTDAMAARLDGLRQRLAAGPVTLTGVVPLSGRGTGVARKRAVQVRKYLRAEGVTVASLILLSKATNPSMTRSVLFATQ